MNKHFTASSTNACKGIALFFLLWHHLFYKHPEFGLITYKMALLAKVCVAMFVILSGYGFSESIKKQNVGLWMFYKKRLTNLYFNYWLVAFIFVLIGVLFAGRSLSDAFGSHAYIKFVIQMAGLYQFVYGGPGYNATWWYMSVIIPLVILFPLLYKLIYKYGIFVPLVCLGLLLPAKPVIPVLNTWLLPFALGVYFSQKNSIVAVSDYLNKFGVWRFVVLLVALFLVAAIRGHNPILKNEKIDWLFGSLTILLIFEVTTLYGVMERTFGFFGLHLFNIFLFHTFIFYYFWSGFIYSPGNPMVVFALLLSLSVVVSLAIEQLKRRIYFAQVVERISSFPFPKR